MNPHSSPDSRSDRRMDELIATVEERFGDLAARARKSEELLEQVNNAIASMPAHGGGENGNMQAVLERASETVKQAERVREIVATLPEIVSSQLDLIRSIDTQVGTLSSRVDTVGEHLDVLRKDQLQSGQGLTAINERMRKVSGALNVLRDALLKQDSHITKQAAQVDVILTELRGGREAHAAQQASLRDHVAARADRAAGRATMALVFSIIAALASIGAGVKLFLG